MDIEAQFSADVTVDKISANTVTETRLNVTLMQTRIECKLSRQNIEDNMIHIRQTGHVNLEAAWSEPETDCEALNLIQLAIINVLKSVDCDLPPLAELCQVRIHRIFLSRQTHLCLVAAHQKNLLFTWAEKEAQKFACVLHTVTKTYSLSKNVVLTSTENQCFRGWIQIIQAKSEWFAIVHIVWKLL